MRLAHFFVNHTAKTCLLSITLPIICLVIVFASGSFALSDTSTREYYVLKDERTQLDDARNAARDTNPFLEPGQDISTLAQLQLSTSMSINILMRGIRENGNIADLDSFNTDTTSSVLSPAVFAQHKKIEDEFLLRSNYSSFCKRDPTQVDCSGQPRQCALPNSFLNHPALYGELLLNTSIVCGRRSGNEPVSQAAFDSFISSIYGDDPYRMRVFFDINSTASPTYAWASKSLILIGSPLVGYNSSNDRVNEQEDEFTDWGRDAVNAVNNRKLSNENVDVFALSSTIVGSDFNDIITKDLSLAGVAIILVLIVIWIHTTSFVIAIATIFQILVSFPYTYFFYYIVFRQLYFGALQVLTVFLLLGIGADDVFVFTDAWKQAAIKLGDDVDLETRMSWTYRRSVRAMTVTSFTTAFAFAVTAISPLMPISTLGIWAAVLVLLQFSLICTFYPCVVVTWHRFWRPRLWVRGFRKVESPEELELELATKWWQRIIPASRRPEPKVKQPGEYRSIERFFRGPWLNFLKKGRYIVVIFSFVFAGLSLWQGLQLETPRESESLLPDYHETVVATTALNDGFPRSDVNLQLQVWAIWGVRGVDRSGLTRFDVTDLGQAEFDTDFDFTRSAVQQRVLDACTFFGSQEDLIFSANAAINPINCWISDYHEWRNGSFADFDSQEALIDDLLAFSEASEAYAAHFNLQRIAFNANRTRVVFTEVGFVGSTDANAPESVMWPIFQQWDGLMDDFNAESPTGGNAAFVTAGHPWIWSVTQQTLVRSMLQGLLIMVCVAFLTLMVATTNWFVAIAATVCITGVICNLLGLINLAGWSLGTTESVSVIIGVGYSFDGTAHMATAYVEAESTTREDRIQEALTELAISVVFGAITTFFAAAAMTPATIVFFTKFSLLLIATVILSMLWSIMIFPAYMLCVGPEGTFGSIPALIRKIRGKSEQNEEAGVDVENGKNMKDTDSF